MFAILFRLKLQTKCVNQQRQDFQTHTHLQQYCILTACVHVFSIENEKHSFDLYTKVIKKYGIHSKSCKWFYVYCQFFCSLR